MRTALLLLALAACSPQAPPVEAPAPQVRERMQTTGASGADSRCWYGGCEGPFYSAAPARFGRFEIGATIVSVPGDALTRHGDCADGEVMDCSFTLPDGVEYLVFERWVARKRMLLPTTYALPFGLQGDETPDQLARRVTDLLGAPSRVTEASSGTTIVTHEGALGALESPQWLDFELDANGRLRAITWQGPPTT